MVVCMSAARLAVFFWSSVKVAYGIGIQGRWGELVVGWVDEVG